VAIFPLDGGPEGTGGVCVKAPTDVEAERLALCGLNNTRVAITEAMILFVVRKRFISIFG
jgi:hypothetical protein